MDLSWYHFLNDLDVSCFEERGRMRYALRNTRSEKIYLTDEENAARIIALKADPKAIDNYNEEELKATINIIEKIRTAAMNELIQKKALNPLFIRWAGINLQMHNAWMARWANRIARLIYPVVLILFSLAVFFATSSEWQIADGVQAALSLEGLALFAALSPILKIPHEFGHAFTARYFNIPLHSAGIVFVGFFPLPFVDASPADVFASRSQRIRISSAGIFVDLIIALIAIIIWHLVEGEFAKTIFASIFTFSSLNSLLFNGNPFIRLDGYYVFSDWIGHRNLSTNSGLVLRRLRQWVSSFSWDGGLPERSEVGYLFYGIGSAIYKIVILFTIVWMILPRFFGLGVFFAIWGGYVMFLSPLMRSHSAMESEKKAPKMIFNALAIGAVIALMFLPLPLILKRQATLDTQNTYLVQSEESGYLAQIASKGPLDAGKLIYQLDSLILSQDLVNAQSQIEALELLKRSVEQVDPYQTKLAETELAGVIESREILNTRIAKLTNYALTGGVFIPALNLRDGQFITEAENLGYYLPDADQSTFLTDFPQHRLAKLKGAQPKILLQIEDSIIEATGFNLIAGQELDTLGMILVAPISPIKVHSKAVYVKIHLGKQPLYQHIFDWYDRLLSNFRRSLSIK